MAGFANMIRTLVLVASRLLLQLLFQVKNPKRFKERVAFWGKQITSEGSKICINGQPQECRVSSFLGMQTFPLFGVTKPVYSWRSLGRCKDNEHCIEGKCVLNDVSEDASEEEAEEKQEEQSCSDIGGTCRFNYFGAGFAGGVCKENETSSSEGSCLAGWDCCVPAKGCGSLGHLETECKGINGYNICINNELQYHSCQSGYFCQYDEKTGAQCVLGGCSLDDSSRVYRPGDKICIDGRPRECVQRSGIGALIAGKYGWKKLPKCGKNEQCENGQCKKLPEKEGTEEEKTKTFSCRSDQEGERRCWQDSVEICHDGTWVKEADCYFGCYQNSCLKPSPREGVSLEPCPPENIGEIRCEGGGYRISVCTKNGWMLSSCPNFGYCINNACVEMKDPEKAGDLCSEPRWSCPMGLSCGKNNRCVSEDFVDEFSEEEDASTGVNRCQLSTLSEGVGVFNAIGGNQYYDPDNACPEGFSCNRTTGICEKIESEKKGTKKAGWSCENDLECESGFCQPLSGADKSFKICSADSEKDYLIRANVIGGSAYTAAMILPLAGLASAGGGAGGVLGGAVFEKAIPFFAQTALSVGPKLATAGLATTRASTGLLIAGLAGQVGTDAYRAIVGDTTDIVESIDYYSNLVAQAGVVGSSIGPGMFYGGQIITQIGESYAQSFGSGSGIRGRGDYVSVSGKERLRIDPRRDSDLQEFLAEGNKYVLERRKTANVSRVPLATEFVANRIRYDEDSSGAIGLRKAVFYQEGGGRASLGQFTRERIGVCREKAAALHVLLASLGKKNEMVTGCVEGGRYRHAWVEYIDSVTGLRMVADATLGEEGSGAVMVAEKAYRELYHGVEGIKRFVFVKP